MGVIYVGRSRRLTWRSVAIGVVVGVPLAFWCGYSWGWAAGVGTYHGIRERELGVVIGGPASVGGITMYGPPELVSRVNEALRFQVFGLAWLERQAEVRACGLVTP